MTVRMTRVKSDGSTRVRESYAPPAGSPPESPVAGAPVEHHPERGLAAADPDPAVADPAPEPPTDPVTRPDARRALRVARRQRRRLTLFCALVVAVCLALTLLIVNLARSRTDGNGVVQSGVAVVVGNGPARPAVPYVLTVPSPISNEHPGATAPEGGNP